jgi:UDPglucose 6-dehydrogenase
MIDVADGADVICVFTEWPEFAKIDLAGLWRRACRPVPRSSTRATCSIRAGQSEAGLGYDGVGRR